MSRILIPVDRSAQTLRAVQHAISIAMRAPGTECHLLYVQPPMPVGAHAYWSHHQIEELEAKESEEVLRPACDTLRAAHIPYVAASCVGLTTPVIADYAEKWQCECIVMGTHGIPFLGTLVSAPATAKVLRLSPVPVTLVK